MHLFSPKLVRRLSLISGVLFLALIVAGLRQSLVIPSSTNQSESREPLLVINTDSLPMVVPDSVIKPLRSLLDDELQAGLANIISSRKKWARLAESNKIGIGLVDLRDPYNVRFARINGSNMMYAASLPKIAVLLAAMDAIEKGELQETDEVRRDMKLMISRSDNAASTRMIDRLGYDKIASVLQDPEYELYDEDAGGGLWVGKRYAKSGRRNPDPLKGLSHAATATQVSRFYYLLAYGKLEILTDPKLHHKFVNTLDAVAPRAKLFRKSGSWRTYHSDSVLVWGPEWRRYVLVALVDDEDGEVILRQLMADVDKMMKPTAQ